ncbi:MAG: FHA domain-containing serine/threonine-protein kinase, partial [Chloroflexota bacterium]
MVGQLIGQRVGRYRIDSLIGEGGMGSVLRGFDEMLQRDVAIKILAPQFVRRPNFRERFLQEARTAARLRHPGIVQVFDFGEAPSQLYIVMEFIPGDNLYELLKVLRNRGKQMILTEAIQLVRQVSLAIDYAHRNGVLHRDIKPSNIMLREGADDSLDGLPYQPILTDLGLAKLAEGGIITTVGTSMGTPAYMSPEQTLGDTTGPGSDVYSMGILLFELTTGRLPFPAKSITDAIHYHTKEPPPRPSSIRPELAGQLEQIILKALEKEPQNRYPDAATFANTLAKLVSVSEQAQQAAESVSLFTLYEPSVVAQDKKRRSYDSAVPERHDRLLIMMADQTTKTISLTPAGLSIGRGQDNDLVVDQPNVSRRHARIEHDGRNYQVVDLNSTNGTYLNDLKLLPDVPEVLTKDSTLRVGDTWMRLEPGPSVSLPGSATAVGFSSAVEAKSQTGEIGLKMQISRLTVVPGQSAPVMVDILNQGRRVDHFHITVEGDHADWVSDLPEPVYLMPGEQRTVSFTISPPRQ